MDVIRSSSQEWKGLWNFAKPSIHTICCQVFVVLGTAIGIILRIFLPSSPFDYVISFPAELVTRVLQFVTVPLMTTGVFQRVTQAKVNIDKKTAVRLGLYFTATTTMAVAAGLALVLVIKPGGTFPLKREESEGILTGNAVMNVILNIVPEIFFSVEQPKEFYGFEPEHTNTSTAAVHREVWMDFNVLSLTANVLFYGLTMRDTNYAQSIVLCASQFHEHLLIWTDWAMRLFPLGLMSLAVSHVFEVGNWLDIINFGLFAGVVVIGLVGLGAVIQPLVYAVISGRNPFTVITGVYPALLSAVLTASSSSTLPVTLYCLKERIKLNPRVTHSMLPLVTAVAKEGTILYQVIAVVFISQISHIYLDLTQFVVLVLMVIIFSYRAPGSQEFVIISTLLIMTAADLPLRDCVMLVLGEWLLDRFNTVVNVLTQCFSISLAHHLLPPEEEGSDVQNQD